VASTSAPVLILGENGTGKEMVARALHRRSQQRGGPFVPINCNAIPENLLESELFGTKRARSRGPTPTAGALSKRPRGHDLPDEIGELPAPLQVKLLRFLQEKTFQRVGGRQEIQSDARVIAATNINLQEWSRAEVPRGPLLPAGRARRHAAAAAGAWQRRGSCREGVPAALWCPAPQPGLTFAPGALRALSLHTWPGNIRELQNRVQRAVIMAEGSESPPATWNWRMPWPPSGRQR